MNRSITLRQALNLRLPFRLPRTSLAPLAIFDYRGLLVV